MNYSNQDLEVVYDKDTDHIITNDEAVNEVLDEIETESKSLRPGITIEGLSFDEDPTEKTYLVLLWIYPDHELNGFDEPLRDWQIRIGRQDTYDFLKDMVKYESIDPNLSFIMAAERVTEQSNDKENLIFNDSKPITVFRFLKAMREGDMVLDGDEQFDINSFDLESESGDNTILDTM